MAEFDQRSCHLPLKQRLLISMTYTYIKYASSWGEIYAGSLTLPLIGLEIKTQRSATAH